MKKKYLIVLLVTIFCLTGCDVTYNLTITEDNMTESASFLVDNNKDNQSILNQYLSTNYTAYYDMDNRETRRYEKEELNQDDKIGMNLTYNYSEDNLQKSSMLSQCYYVKSITKTKDMIVITTDGYTRCMYRDGTKRFDQLTINITTELEVTENNADSIDGNTYTWVITEDNYQNHPITMKMNLPDENEQEGNSILTTIIIIVVLILAIVGIGVLVYFYLKRKHQKSNEL